MADAGPAPTPDPDVPTPPEPVTETGMAAPGAEPEPAVEPVTDAVTTDGRPDVAEATDVDEAMDAGAGPEPAVETVDDTRVVAVASADVEPPGVPGPEPEAPDTAAGGSLLGDTGGYRARWDDVQAGFVDEPRGSVEGADRLVAEAIAAITEALTQQRAVVEAQWRGDSQASTEELRLLFQRYRSMYERLLST